MIEGFPIGETRPFAEFDQRFRAEVTRPKFPFERLSTITPVLTGSWLIKGLLVSTGLAVIFGAPVAGKSFTALAAGMHVAAGLPWAGRKVRQAGVVYFAAEVQKGFRNRVHAIRTELGLSCDIPFVLVTVAPNLGVAEGDASILIREVREQAAHCGFRPGLIFIDTLARTMVGADENSVRDMGFFVANANLIGSELAACVAVVHHAGKNQDRGMRGSSALHGATDVEWEITSDENGRRLRIAKMKEAEDGLSFMFRLRVVTVGIDEDGDPVTTCVADVSTEAEHTDVPVDKPNCADGSGKKLSGQNAEFVKAVGMAIEAFGETIPHNNYVALNTKGVTRQHLALYAEQLGFSDGATPEARKSIRNRLIRKLAGDGLLCQWGEWIWLP